MELKNITAARLIASTNTQTYKESQTSYSLYHILHRRYYLAIAQITYTRKPYIS